MNDFMKMLKGIRSYMYDRMKAGFSMPVAGATGGAIYIDKLDELNASKSKRVMRTQRGRRPDLIGIRRFDRNLEKHIKRFDPSLIGA